MRTAKIEINGKDYLLCFSTRVMRDCAKRYGGLENIGGVISGDDAMKTLDESIWLLAQMMAAGAKYAKLEGIETPEPLSYEDLYDAFGVDDWLSLKAKVMETISEGTRREIETEPEEGKNAKATPRN